VRGAHPPRQMPLRRPALGTLWSDDRVSPTWHAILFYGFSILTVVSASAVIAARSPINSAMSLVAAFFFLAGIYVLLLAHTIAILQVLVYAGAIMVLFLFVIMLLSL